MSSHWLVDARWNIANSEYRTFVKKEKVIIVFGSSADRLICINKAREKYALPSKFPSYGLCYLTRSADQNISIPTVVKFAFVFYEEDDVFDT